MDVILQTTFSSVFWCINMFELCLKFQWGSSLRVCSRHNKKKTGTGMIYVLYCPSSHCSSHTH